CPASTRPRSASPTWTPTARAHSPSRSSIRSPPTSSSSGKPTGLPSSPALRGSITSMNNPETDKVFAGSIPSLYQTHLVPLIFEPYAADLAQRLRTRTLSRVLEIAAGTGVVTRALAAALPETVSIVATDLNQAMLDHASTLGTKSPVEWCQ